MSNHKSKYNKKNRHHLDKPKEGAVPFGMSLGEQNPAPASRTNQYEDINVSEIRSSGALNNPFGFSVRSQNNIKRFTYVTIAATTVWAVLYQDLGPTKSLKYKGTDHAFTGIRRMVFGDKTNPNK